MYFNIAIDILDQYSFECDKVHLLVFINYLIEKCTVKHKNSVVNVSLPEYLKLFK